jgi:anti-anti-sigma factor
MSDSVQPTLLALLYDEVVTDIRVLAFHGEIDISRKWWIEKELDRIELFDPQSVTIIDMTDVRYADTTFLNALIKVRRKLGKRVEGRIYIVAPRLARIFEITGLDREFPMFDSVSSARMYASSHEFFDGVLSPARCRFAIGFLRTTWSPTSLHGRIL